MYKILHLHSDIKFAFDSLRFVDENIINHILFLGEENENNLTKLNSLNIPFTCKDANELNKENIEQLIHDFDAIVFYSLNSTHEKILNLIPPTIPKFLRFFGFELYALLPNRYLSKETIRYYYPIKFVKRHFLNYLYKMTNRYLGNEFTFDKNRQKDLYQKFDGIIMINEFEYQDLGKYFYLPPFIQINFMPNEERKEIHHFKSKKIVIGNSRHMWNNHLEILKIIKNFKTISYPKFTFLFNYGKESIYTQQVRKKAKDNPQIELIDDFLAFSDFDKIYKDSSALVINSYRQHAMGNIFAAIFKGCKVYLNKKSSTYKWLVHYGFKIYDIDTLKADIQNDNIELAQESKEHNLQSFENLRKDSTQKKFIESVISKITK